MTISEFYSLPENFSWVCQATTPAEKQKRIAILKKQWESDFSSDTQADFLAPERTETAIFDIRRLVVRANVADSIKTYLTSRNESIRKQKEKQKEKEKADRNRNVSRPFWF